VAAISSVGAYVPVQRVQAERAAAQAEGRAQRLAAESQQARNQANQLNQRADRLREASGQAQNEASNARRSGESSPAVSQVGRPVAAALPSELRTPEPAPVRTGVAGPASVAESVSSINRYLQVGAPNAPAAPGATLNVSA
jgi:hypothetical protein